MDSVLNSHRAILGVDTGGTFTDFVWFDGQRLRVHKVLSTPEQPERAILDGIRELELDGRALLLVHGSTVATNAVLEGKGARTAFITNRGLGDVLSIARQQRPELYDLQPAPLAVPVPRELCVETGGRMAADGTVVEDLPRAELRRLAQQLQRLRPRAVAISLLFSFLDERFERAVEAAVPAHVFTSRSSEILPEYREYERGIATWLNAYVGPLMQGYLDRLTEMLAPARVTVMQSSGVTRDAASAGHHGVRLLLSGPAAGIQGARHAGRGAGCERLLSIDMGGTSTDVALVAGELSLTSEGRIGPYPVAVPMVDMHTIGAGGGSIAAVDAGGLLQVGPESAGAEPGPACYGRGGQRPTVTDANVVLGRLPAFVRLAGTVPLDAAAAQRAYARLANQLGVADAMTAALGVVRVVNEHMVQALRVISVQRGHDPKDFVLLSFGGAGGLHICDLATALGMSAALIPPYPGVLSALGMLVAPPGRELSRTLAGPLEDVSDGTIEESLQRLREQGLADLAGEEVAAASLVERASLDLCYRGQSFALNVDWRGRRSDSEEQFHRLHERRYGHRLDNPLELVNVRLSLRAPAGTLTMPTPGRMPGSVHAVTRVFGCPSDVPVWERDALAVDQRIDGPAIVVESVATSYIAPGWRARVDAAGNLCLSARGTGPHASSGPAG